MVTDEELEEIITETCTKSFNTFLHLSQQHATTLRDIRKVIRLAKREQLLAYAPRLLILNIVRIMVYYEIKSRASIGIFWSWNRRSKIRLARQCFHDLLRVYIPEKVKELVAAVLSVIYTDRIWKFEAFCFELVAGLLDEGITGAIITEVLWNKIETSDPHLIESRATIKILYELLDSYEWSDSYETVLIIERMLNLFYISIMRATAANARVTDIAFKKGLEVCIRNMIKHVSNDHVLIFIQYMCAWAMEERTSDNIILEFGCTLEYAAYLHKVLLYEKTLTPKIFPLLMGMIASESKIINLLGNRVMHYLLDRNENKIIFDTPKIFFEDTHSNVRIGKCYKEDKLFCKIHREVLHDSLLKSVINHSNCRVNLEASYCTICLIATEVPCGFTAAAIVCYGMNLQDITLKRYEDYHLTACHIHATVIALMSLLCWIHKAKVFHACVSKIMMQRAQWAPHLNPPIQSRYNFSVHHVLWDKPDLFFVDWEARYGLWKCFRLQENQENTRVRL